MKEVIRYLYNMNPISGKNSYLRKLTQDDATQAYCDWLNDPEVNAYLETKQATIESIQKFIKEKNESPMALLLGIFWRETDLHIGNVKLEPIINNLADIGILVGDKSYWGKGVAT